MANYWTYGDVRTKVENDLSIQDEQFIYPEELLGYCNDGIDKAEALILDLNEDYFLTQAPLTLVDGQAIYTLPSDICLNKIRSIVVQDGLWTYPIKKLKGAREFFAIAQETGPLPSLFGYHYDLMNPSRTDLTLVPATNLVLYPAVRVGDTAKLKVTVSYIRSAARVTQDSDYSDLPEARGFVMAYMKMQISKKDPTMGDFTGDLEQEKDLMLAALADRTPDGDNKIMPDMSFYMDHS